MHSHIRVNCLMHVHTGYNRVNADSYVTAIMEIHASFSAYDLKVAEALLNYAIGSFWTVPGPRVQSFHLRS